ncbi:10184_t:CDS:1, partial [Funneliformis geosporum]
PLTTSLNNPHDTHEVKANNITIVNVVKRYLRRRNICHRRNYAT